MSIELTTNETAVLTAVSEGRFEFFDGGFEVNSDSWHDVFTDNVASLLQISKQAAGGVVSSMIQKGIFVSNGTGRDGAVFLTQAGIDAI